MDPASETGRMRALFKRCYPYGFVGEVTAMFSLSWPMVCVNEIS